MTGNQDLYTRKVADAGAVEDLEISQASEDVSFSVGDSFESFDDFAI